MTEAKKTTQRRTANKKPIVKKEEVKEVQVEPKEKPQETPKRAKKIEIDRNEMIPTRSANQGELIYISNRTKAMYTWEDFGTTVYLEMGELQDMNGSNRRFLHDGYLVVDDEQAAEALGLSKLYKELSHLDNLDELFEKDAEDLLVIIPKLPKGMRSTLATKARELVEDGTLDRIGKIRAVENALGIDLEGFIVKK